MYKIVTDISIITAINEAAKVDENNNNTNYCEIHKHPVNDEYAIPIIEGILKKYNLPNIDYILSDNVEVLPDDWSWPFSERTIRISIPLKLQAKAFVKKAKKKDTDSLTQLGTLFDSILSSIPDYIIITDGNVIVYLEELYTDDRTLLELYPEILIEE